MATNPFADFNFNDEEEQSQVTNPFADYDFDGQEQSAITDPFEGFDFETMSSGPDAVAASVDLFKQRQGFGGQNTLQQLTGLTGISTDSLQNLFKGIEEEGEKGLENWTPRYINESFMRTPNKPGWIAETVKSQAGETGFIYGMAMLSNKLPGPMGNITRLGTAGTIYNSMHAEALEEIARKSNKQVEQLDEGEKTKAAVVAGINTALETVFPFKSMGKPLVKFTGKPRQDLKKIENVLKDTKLQTKPQQIKEFSKALGKQATGEAITENLEGVVTSIASSPGIGYELTPQGLEEAVDRTVGGFFGGGVYGSPTSVSAARSQNRQLRQMNELLKAENRSNLLDAGRQYDKQYRQQAALGPVAEFDVTPNLYETQEYAPTYLQKMGTLGRDLLFGRATNVFQDAMSKAKTGKDVSILYNDLFSMFGDVESMSGETQTGVSFDTYRSQLLGKYNKPFERILQKWSKGTIGTGQMFQRVDPNVDAYITAKLTGKDTEAYELGRKTGLSRSQLNDLDVDIRELRKIQDEIYSEAKRVLKDSGLDIGYTEGYLSRGINRDAVKNNKEGFIKSVTEDIGYSTKEAEDIWKKIVDGKDPNLMSSEQIRSGKRTKGMGKASFEKERQKKWEKLSDEFRETSALKSIQQYIVNTTSRIASAEKFGGRNAEKLNLALNKALKRGLLNKNEVQQVWDMYDAEHRLYGQPQTAAGEAGIATSRALSNLAAIKLLGLAALSSLPELGWMPARVGMMNMMKAAPKAAGYFLKGFLQSAYPGGTGEYVKNAFAKDLIQTLGMGMSPIVNERIEALMGGDVNPFMNKWFRGPGGLFLTQYTNFVRAWTASAALQMIDAEAKRVLRGTKLKGKHKAALERELRENGLTINDFRQIARLGNGKIDILNDQFLDTRFTKEDGTEVSVRDVIVPWVRKITTDVALEPRPTNRPLWMANPKLQLVSQLKSFPVVFANNILKRTYRQLNPKVCTPGLQGNMGVVAGVAAALGLAALVLEAKRMIKGQENELGVIDLLSAVGIPYAGTDSFAQAASLPAAAFLDSIVMPLFTSDNPIGDSMEGVVDIIVRAFAGAIFAEGMK